MLELIINNFSAISNFAISTEAFLFGKISHLWAFMSESPLCTRACAHTHTHTHPTHISLTWKSLLHGELYHTLNQVTSNIWWRHILHSLKYKSWKGKQSGKIIWIMWGCLLAFHSISRGLRPRWVANGGGESPPFPHPLCAAQSCEASWIIQLLNTS